jgi:hypothetical protein
MSLTGKGNDSPCIPHCARRGPVSCTLSCVRGGITSPAQGSTARFRRICGTCKARTEGAGRSSPCLPEAVYFCFRFCMSPTGKGNDSPCIPPCDRRGPVSCALAGVRGGITGPAQDSTARRRRICGTCKARTEGAGRSSPCLPEAVFISGIFMSATCMTSLRLYLSGTGIDPCGACDSFFLHRKG